MKKILFSLKTLFAFHLLIKRKGDGIIQLFYIIFGYFFIHPTFVQNHRDSILQIFILLFKTFPSILFVSKLTFQFIYYHILNL